MFSTVDLSNLSFYNNEADVVTCIEKSLQTRQISRLKPSFLADKRPRTSNNSRSVSKEEKIIPELKAAVDTLKTRLRQRFELKLVPRPSDRLKFVINNEELFPGKYHQKTESVGGFEFSKAPRMQSSIDHKLICVSKIFTPKTNKKVDFELKNIQTINNISEYYTGIRTRTRKHNEKVSTQAQAARLKKSQEKELKKSEYLYKTERFRWMQMHGNEIEVAKRKWSNVLVCYSVACRMRQRILKTKVVVR